MLKPPATRATMPEEAIQPEPNLERVASRAAAGVVVDMPAIVPRRSGAGGDARARVAGGAHPSGSPSPHQRRVTGFHNRHYRAQEVRRRSLPPCLVFADQPFA